MESFKTSTDLVPDVIETDYVEIVNIGYGCSHPDTIPVKAIKCKKCQAIIVTASFDPWV